MGVSSIILWISATLLPFYLIRSTQGQYSGYYHNIINGTNTSWKNNKDLLNYNFSSGASAQIILLSNSGIPTFACGFIGVSNFSCENSLFAIFTVEGYQGDNYSYILFSVGEPRILWSSNRNRRVGCSATLLLTGDGDLILKDDDGALVWSTKTKGKSVAGLNLTQSGNLVLFDTKNSIVWQSFDHPTDTLLLGQKLYSGQKLISKTSSTNSSQGLHSLSLNNGTLSAFLESDPSLVYFSKTYPFMDRSIWLMYAMLSKTSFGVFATSSEVYVDPWAVLSFPRGSSMLHVRLDFDGHLKVYDWVDSGWNVVADILAPDIGVCGYPMVCGKYGICSRSADDSPICSCPQSADNTNLSYYKQVNERYPNLGCNEINPLSCEDSKSQKLVELQEVNHCTGMTPDITNTDLKNCKLSCLKNCSCKAAMFLPFDKVCYLVPQVFSLINTESNPKKDANFNLFLKVQDKSIASTQIFRRKRSPKVIILGWSLGAFSGLLLIFGIVIFLSRKKEYASDSEEDYLDHVPGMPKRYSYEDLIGTTENFSKKLGQGGFGSVFEGTLSNGTMVAVKCLDGLGQIKESFLSEVKTIGSIHHLNLVRLVGYCNNKSHRLLVYDYMSNGSLDKWIFHGSKGSALDWQTRRMIILDIAKGLAYLHDDCTQKILHLDIKPQNILLDENFRAKVSDFGLSKLIDRDQSHVVTMMKGTPGYLAPEWLNSIITEKVDVYSFGVVVLEILCGRRNLDRSQPEEDMHLLSLFKRKAEQDELLDMIDKQSEDMLSNGTEVMKMMKIAAWCLQSEYAKRPSMSVVVKVLEGPPDVEEIKLDYDFSFPPVSGGTSTLGPSSDGSKNVTTPVLPSILSGPR